MSCGVGCRCGSDPELLCLWYRPAAIAPIRPLAWELPYASGVALTRQKQKQKTGAWPHILHKNQFQMNLEFLEKDKRLSYNLGTEKKKKSFFKSRQQKGLRRKKKMDKLDSIKTKNYLVLLKNCSLKDTIKNMKRHGNIFAKYINLLLNRPAYLFLYLYIHVWLTRKP